MNVRHIFVAAFFICTACQEPVEETPAWEDQLKKLAQQRKMEVDDTLNRTNASLDAALGRPSSYEMTDIAKARLRALAAKRGMINGEKALIGNVLNFLCPRLSDELKASQISGASLESDTLTGLNECSIAGHIPK